MQQATRSHRCIPEAERINLPAVQERPCLMHRIVSITLLLFMLLAPWSTASFAADSGRKTSSPTPVATPVAKPASPKDLVLRLTDLPSGFTQGSSRSYTNAQAAQADLISVAKLEQEGRITSYETAFVRNPAQGMLHIMASIVSFKGTSGAHWQLGRALRPPSAQNIDIGRLGDEGVGYSLTSPGRVVTAYGVIFRRGAYVATVIAAGETSTFTPLGVIQLARAMDTRMQGTSHTSVAPTPGATATPRPTPSATATAVPPTDQPSNSGPSVHICSDAHYDHAAVQCLHDDSTLSASALVAARIAYTSGDSTNFTSTADHFGVSSVNADGSQSPLGTFDSTSGSLSTNGASVSLAGILSLAGVTLVTGTTYRVEVDNGNTLIGTAGFIYEDSSSS